MTDGLRTAIYCRLSKNRAGLSDSVAIQEREAREYAETRGWPVVAVYPDDDVRASRFTKMPRPQYEALVAAIERGEIEAVLCTEMPRLYRRLEELLDLIRLAERTNLKRIETTDGYGYHLNTGEGVHSAVAAINNAVLESRRISDRVKRKHRARARAGLHNGGSRRYGYEPDSMTVRESEAAIIRECIERSIAGEPAYLITKDLNERGVPTAYDNKWRTPNLQRLLLSDRIIGVRDHNGAKHPAQWPAITTREDQERVRVAWSARKQPAPGRPRGARSYLLTGFAYCSKCGGVLRGNGRVSRGKYCRRYTCRVMNDSSEPVGCGKTYRNADPLETWVTEAVLYRFDSPDAAQALAGPESEEEIGQLVTEIEFHRRKLDDYVDDYASGLLSREQLARAKARTEAELDDLHQRLSRLQSQQIAVRLPTEPLREVWDSMNLEWQRSIIRLLVDRVTVLPGHPRGKRWRQWQFDPQYVEIAWRA
jgi:DNA invertase Pin-like site-specific DNA recombinase